VACCLVLIKAVWKERERNDLPRSKDSFIPDRCWRVCIWGATIGCVCVCCCDWFVVVGVVASLSEVVTVMISCSGFVPFGVKHVSHANASCVLTAGHAKHAHVSGSGSISIVAFAVVVGAVSVVVVGADTTGSSTSFVTKSSDVTVMISRSIIF